MSERRLLLNYTSFVGLLRLEKCLTNDLESFYANISKIFIPLFEGYITGLTIAEYNNYCRLAALNFKKEILVNFNISFKSVDKMLGNF